jgi:hypothetical protein
VLLNARVAPTMPAMSDFMVMLLCDYFKYLIIKVFLRLVPAIAVTVVPEDNAGLQPREP